MSLHFLFVQFEFTHAVGPHAGRYVVATSTGGDESPDPGLDARNQHVAGVSRGIGDSDVLIVDVIGAPAARMRLLRKARPVRPDAPPRDVPLSVVTFVKGRQPVKERGQAGRQLDEIRFSEEQQDRRVEEALRVLNLAIRAHRAGAPDPYAIEVTRRDARRVRIGYGSTEQVQDGLWQEALELPPPAARRPKRIERLRPAEAVASVLSGQSTVLEAEDLLARVVIDLDNRRTRAAAFQLGGAIRSLCAEVRELGQKHAGRAQKLEDAASGRELDDAEVDELEAIIDAVAAALDERRYSGSS